jgi:acylphosphatase
MQGDLKRVHIVIYGEVQGVFFRSYVKKTADSLGVKGFVMNKPKGTVEAVAEGSKEKLDELLKKCSEGPQIASVVEVRRSWEPATGEFKDFKIMY